MQKSRLQKISNILFHILLICSVYISLNSKFAPWEDFALLLNCFPHILIFLSGFFHHISYKYDSLKILSAIILILRGVTGIAFATINNNGWQFIDIVAFVILLILHFVACGKSDCEIITHTVDVKTTDGRYEKVTIKEKIKCKINDFNAMTLMTEFLKSILVLLIIFFILACAWIVFFIVDSEADFKEKAGELPSELVSQEYLDEFDLHDYVRFDTDYKRSGLCVSRDNAYYGTDVAYIIISKPTKMISDSDKSDKNTYWQMGDNNNFIMNLVDEDFGNYSEAYYMNMNCALPDEEDKIIKVMLEDKGDLKLSEKQIKLIEDYVENLDGDLTETEANQWSHIYSDNYELVFCFEGYDDIRLTCCNVVKDINGQWYLYKNYYSIGVADDRKDFYDLEKLPQDISDTINQNLSG